MANLESAGDKAKSLIAKVGGPIKICNEANELFQRFDGSKQKFLNSSELKDYPGLAALGTSHVLVPGRPTRISIRVGTHRDGFFIEIVNTNGPSTFAKSQDALELFDSCIFVHR